MERKKTVKKRRAKRSKERKISMGLEILNPERLKIIAVELKEFSKNDCCGAFVLGHITKGKVIIEDLIIPQEQSMWEDFFEINEREISATLKNLKGEGKLCNIRAFINFVNNCASLEPSEDLIDTMKKLRKIDVTKDIFYIILDCRGNYQIITHKTMIKDTKPPKSDDGIFNSRKEKEAFYESMWGGQQTSLSFPPGIPSEKSMASSSSAWRFCPRHPLYRSAIETFCPHPDCHEPLVDEEELEKRLAGKIIGSDIPEMPELPPEP